jgi:hypothetical protein
VILLRAHGRVRLVLLLPLLVVTAAVSVVAFNASQRVALVDEFTRILEHGTTEEAIVVIAQLAAIDRPPIDVLVSATAAPDAQVAAAAKQSIRNLLADCVDQVQEGRNIAKVADFLSELVSAFSQRHQAFAAADQTWIAETIRAVLRLANKLPPHVAPTLAAECDAILSATEMIALAQTKFAPVQPTRTSTARESGGFALSDPQDRANPWPRQPSPIAIALQPAPAASASTLPPQAIAAPFSSAGEDVSRVEGAEPKTSATPASPNSLRSGSFPVAPTLPVAPTTPPVSTGAASLNILPPATTTVPQSEPSRFRRPVAFAIQQLPTLDSRSLLAALSSEHGVNAVAIADELARRGFGRVTKQLVDQFLSHSPADRLRLVEVVLNDPSIGPRPWLLLLAEDPDADVRLLAITVLATSRDAALLERTWQIAIRDRDPRIADLAPRLRERQAAGRR